MRWYFDLSTKIKMRNRISFGFFAVMATVFGFTSSCQSISHRRGADPEVAIQHFKTHLGTSKKCADDIVNARKDKEGEVTVQWTVNDKGKVLNPMVVNNTFGDVAIGECFLHLLNSLDFPPTPLFSKATVEYTFRWTSLVQPH